MVERTSLLEPLAECALPAHVTIPPDHYAERVNRAVGQIFIDNLPPSATEEAVKKLAEEQGGDVRQTTTKSMRSMLFLRLRAFSCTHDLFEHTPRSDLLAVTTKSRRGIVCALY